MSKKIKNIPIKGGGFPYTIEIFINLNRLWFINGKLKLIALYIIKINRLPY